MTPHPAPMKQPGWPGEEELARIIDPRPWAHPMSWPDSWGDNSDVDHAKLVATQKARAVLALLPLPTEADRVHDEAIEKAAKVCDVRAASLRSVTLRDAITEELADEHDSTAAAIRALKKDASA